MKLIYSSFLKIALALAFVISLNACKKDTDGEVYLEVEAPSANAQCYKVTNFKAGTLGFYYDILSDTRFVFDKYYHVEPGTADFTYKLESTCGNPPLNFVGSVTLESAPGTKKQKGKSNRYDLGLAINGPILELHKAAIIPNSSFFVDVTYYSNGNPMRVKGKYTVGPMGNSGSDQAKEKQ
jgi:hypothetical protein